MKVITDHCFEFFPSLRFLSAKYNNISKLQRYCLAGLTQLKSCDLSFNKLSYLDTNIFSVAKRLKSLNLLGNDIMVITEAVEIPFINELLTDNYHVCCYLVSPVTNCSAKPSYLSSCDDLLSMLSMKFLTFIQGAAAFLLNMISIFIRLVPGHFDQAMDKNVIAIAISDGTLGLYLLFIASADQYYRGNFAGHEISWKRSVPCIMATGLYTFFMLSSVIAMSTLAAIRLIAVRFPFSASIDIFPKLPKIIKITKLLIIVLTTWIVSSYYGATLNSSPNSLCILVNFGESNVFLGILTAMTAILQLVGLACIASCYLGVKLILRNTGSTDKNVANRRNASLSSTIILAMISNILCWLPSSLIFLITLGGVQIPLELMVWNVILITPINSTINGLIFSIGSKDFWHLMSMKFGKKDIEKDLSARSDTAENNR